MSRTAECIGPYQIRGEIGHGGMGVVYLGFDPRLDRNVAIKTLRSDLSSDREARERFLREARAVAAISHPNVIQIYDIGEQAGMCFFAMEYVDGKSLRRLLDETKKLPYREAVELARQAAVGLKAAADRGIIHRDVKPSNLILTAGRTLKVTDFGLAKQVVGDTQLTAAGVFAGTPDYIAPERASGEETTLTSDIYSLGATLFELVTGRPPFQGSTPVSVIAKHLRQPAPAPRQLNPDVPYVLNFLILRMLAKQPESRPQSYAALVLELDRLLAGDGTEPGARKRAVTTTSVPLRASASGGSWAGRVFAITLVSLALIGAWSLGKNDAPPPEPLRAQDAPAGTESTGNAPAFAGLASHAGELTVVENLSEITPEGRWHVWGRAQNVAASPAANSKIRISLIESSGREVEAVEVPLMPANVGPGERARFDVLLPGSAQDGMIKLELSWGP